MKIQRKWKPGGRPRRRNATKRWVLKQQELHDSMDIDQVFYCCLYANNEDSAIIRRIERDMEYESEMIALEENFWTNHVLAEIPPSYTEDGDSVTESVRRHFGAADRAAPLVLLNTGSSSAIARYMELQEAKRGMDAQTNWQTSLFENLGREWNFQDKCAFYSLSDKQRVTRFCAISEKSGLSALGKLQWVLKCQKELARRHAKQQKIVARMKGLPP